MEGKLAQEVHMSGDYGSEFEYDSEVDRTRSERKDLAQPAKQQRTKVPSKGVVTEEVNREGGRIDRFHVISLDAYARHKKYINDYLLYYGGTAADFQRDTSRDKTDIDVIRENHRFLWNEDDKSEETWEKRLSKKYYDKLFKEYCIVDLSRYKDNKIALRWRTENEVVEGKGHFRCGNKRCKEKEGLRTWEVNFGYVEHGEKKNALVKLRLCPDCSYKLNYHHRKREVIRAKRKSHSKDEEAIPSKKTKHSQESEGDTDNAKAASSSPSGPSNTTESGNPQPSSSSSSSAAAAAAAEGDVWKAPVKVVEDKSRDEEFEDYFEDMFL